jgi:hypothetical protein
LSPARKTILLCIFIYFLCGTGIQTQGFALARQAHYHFEPHFQPLLTLDAEDLLFTGKLILLHSQETFLSFCGICKGRFPEDHFYLVGLVISAKLTGYSLHSSFWGSIISPCFLAR